MGNPGAEPGALELRLLPGSKPVAAPRGMRAATVLPPDTRLEVTLVLRRHTPLPDPSGAAPIPAAQFAAVYGAIRPTWNWSPPP